MMTIIQNNVKMFCTSQLLARKKTRGSRIHDRNGKFVDNTQHVMIEVVLRHITPHPPLGTLDASHSRISAVRSGDLHLNSVTGNSGDPTPALITLFEPCNLKYIDVAWSLPKSELRVGDNRCF